MRILVVAALSIALANSGGSELRGGQSANPGDDCENPYTVIHVPADLPFTIANQTTCGRVDDYSSTCLSAFDGGEDFIVQLEVTDSVQIDVSLDPKGARYSGMLLDSVCPPGSSCLAKATSNQGVAYHFATYLILLPGTYYIMVDTWPPPTCITAFDLTVRLKPPPQPGDNCTSPYVVNIPFDLPYILANGTTCGYRNDYDSTCLGYYDGGEDFILELNVTEPFRTDFLFDPRTSTYSGMLLDSICPPSMNCMAMKTSIGAMPYFLPYFAVLLPGKYYLMIDTWPSPSCIPSFLLEISSPIIPGEKCSYPEKHILDMATLPLGPMWNNTNVFSNDYDSTCLGEFDDGADFVYRLFAKQSMTVNIELDPQGTPGSGMVLSNSCPAQLECPPGWMSADTLGKPHSLLDVELDSGSFYYLMVDSRLPVGQELPYWLTITPVYVCGDANYDASVDISDAVYLIAYIFSGGLPPIPLAAGDANCDDAIDISDPVYVIQFIFSGGAEPCAFCP
jgi:hypothetical protein